MPSSSFSSCGCRRRLHSCSMWVIRIVGTAGQGGDIFSFGSRWLVEIVDNRCTFAHLAVALESVRACSLHTSKARICSYLPSLYRDVASLCRWNRVDSDGISNTSCRLLRRGCTSLECLAFYRIACISGIDIPRISRCKHDVRLVSLGGNKLSSTL